VTNVAYGLTAKKPGSVPSPKLVIEYGTTVHIVRNTEIIPIIIIEGRSVVIHSSYPRLETPLTVQLVDLLCRSVSGGGSGSIGN